MEQQEKDNNVLAQKKECEPQEHYFDKIPCSASIPLWDKEKEEWYGLGFKTWVCIYCDKKVKSS
jgi:hypothetical protein